MEKIELRKSQKIYLPFKRAIGIFGSFIGIFVCFAFLWWWIFPINFFLYKGHPIFTHYRVGQNGKRFKLLKFRSMKLGTNPNMTSEYANTDELTTKFGKFLRVTSFDETLQLFNVFVGHMAFIGPRPLIDAHEDHETIEIRKQNGAYLLKPGISGYAQVHGRTGLSPKEKGDMDGYYFKKLGFFYDTKLFIETIFKVLSSGRGK